MKYRKNNESEKKKQKNRGLMVTSNCAVCSSKKSRFIKEQEARGLLSSLAKRASLIRIVLVGPILFLS